MDFGIFEARGGVEVVDPFFLFFCFFKKFIFFIKVELIYTVSSISLVQKSDPITEFPVLDSRTSIPIHSKCNSLHPATPNSLSIPTPSPLLPGNHSLLCTSLTCFCSVDNIICAILESPHVSDIIWSLSFCGHLV